MKMKRVHLKTKFLAMFSVFIVIVLVAIGLTISMGHRANILDDYAKRASDIASLAASYLNGEKLVKYSETLQKDAEFELYREKLLTLKEYIESVEYLYVMVPNEECTKATYIFDIYTDEEYAAGDVDEGALGFIEDLSEELFSSAKEVYFTGKRLTDLEITESEYGYLASTYAPVKNAAGKTVALVGVDVDMKTVIGYMTAFTIQMMAIVGCIVLLGCVILLIVIQKSVINPVRLLDRRVCEFAASDHTEHDNGKYYIHIDTKDEFRDVAHSFNRMMDEIENYITNLARVTAEKERISAELDVAKQIQASMLPSIFPPFPDRDEFDVYASMVPAKEVGGDFYDFFMVDEDHLAVVIADVSGKGVPAALFMVIAKTLIKNQLQKGDDPAEVFTAVNMKLCENNEAGMFVTAWMGLLEISTGKFVYVNAGHNPPLLKKPGGEFEYLRSRPGFVLAGMEGVKYRSNEITLGHGDVLYLYTDGVTEATSTRDELYGESRLKQILDKNAYASLSGLLATVKKDIDLFVDGAEQFDDITMLGLRIK